MTLGTFTQLTNLPFDALKVTQLAGSGSLLWVGLSTADLWRLDESSGTWQSFRLPYTGVRGITPRADGTVNLGNGNAPGRVLLLDPASGDVETANVFADSRYWFAGLQLPDGTQLEFGPGSSYLVSTDKGYNRVWAGADGRTFSLRGTVPGLMAAILCGSLSADGTTAYCGGEIDDVYASADGGATWSGTGISNAAGYKGNTHAVQPLAGGTILATRQQGNGPHNLHRLPPGGSWAVSDTGLPGYTDVRSLTMLPSGTIVATLGNTSSTGGTYASYDDGLTWAAAPGAPSGATGRTDLGTATAANCYVWCKAAGLFVAANG